jgi:hypothetical protein
MTIKVIQADREAALRAMHRIRGYAVGIPSDNHHMVQAFASHADPLRRALEVSRDFLLNHRDNAAAEMSALIVIDAALSNTQPSPAYSMENHNGD